jgi:hypothetical protein
VLWEIATRSIPIRGGVNIAEIKAEQNCPERFKKLIEGCMKEKPNERMKLADVIHQLQTLLNEIMPRRVSVAQQGLFAQPRQDPSGLQMEDNLNSVVMPHK